MRALESFKPGQPASVGDDFAKDTPSVLSMHIAFLAPEYPSDQFLFVLALKRVGARVSGIGGVAWHYLSRDLRGLLDDYERVDSVEHGDEVIRAASVIHARCDLDRVEAVHEKQVLPAAQAREALGLEGTSVKTIHLCRDKLAMKTRLRRAGIPCADCEAASSEQEVRRAVDRLGYPLVIKPRQGYGGLKTYRVEYADELATACSGLDIRVDRPVVIESLVEGCEGFLDSLLVNGRIEHAFLARYDPNVLTALSCPEMAAKVASDNRFETDAYLEVRSLGERVAGALELGTLATHMEFFESPDGLVFSEIGARPPGERLWELHSLGNDLDLHHEWASAIVLGRTDRMASRRLFAGSVQVRPTRQGRIAGYRGLERLRDLSPWIVSSQILTRGYPTTPLAAGYLGNVWFRLVHPDVDQLHLMLDRIGSELEVLVE